LLSGLIELWILPSLRESKSYRFQVIFRSRVFRDKGTGRSCQKLKTIYLMLYLIKNYKPSEGAATRGTREKKNSRLLKSAVTARHIL